MEELDIGPTDWLATLCQEGHGLCYEITHMGSRFHFQPAGLEWDQAQLMKTLDSMGCSQCGHHKTMHGSAGCYAEIDSGILCPNERNMCPCDNFRSE